MGCGDSLMPTKLINIGDNMSNRFDHNGIKLTIKKVDSDYVCFAKKDGETKHFYEDTDHASVLSTVKAEIAKGIDWDQLPS